MLKQIEKEKCAKRTNSINSTVHVPLTLKYIPTPSEF